MKWELQRATAGPVPFTEAVNRSRLMNQRFESGRVHLGRLPELNGVAFGIL